MKTAEEWKIERWEDKDYIITGFGLNHAGVYSKREAEIICNALKNATLIIQKDAFRAGMEHAANEIKVRITTLELNKAKANIFDLKDCVDNILTAAKNLTKLPKE